MSIDVTSVACGPDNDNKSWDADDEECAVSTNQDSSWDERRAIDSRYSYEYTGSDKRNEEKSPHSILAETRARIDKEWDEWVWGDVSDFHMQNNGPDHMAAFREGPFWNAEGGTRHWKSSDSGPLNDNIASRARDGLNCVKGLGLNVEGFDHLEFPDSLVVQAGDGGGETVDGHDLGCNIGFDLACDRVETQEQETSILRYDLNCVWLPHIAVRPMEPLPEEYWMRGLGLVF